MSYFSFLHPLLSRQSTHGGGIMIVVAISISSRLVFSSESIIMLAMELYLSLKVLLCCLHAPPSSSPTYLASVLSTVNSLSTNNDTIIAGDFNLPDINWHNLTTL